MYISQVRITEAIYFHNEAKRQAGSISNCKGQRVAIASIEFT